MGPAGRVGRRGCGRRRDALFTTGPGAAPAVASAPIRSRRCLLASARPPSATQGDRGEGSAVLSWEARAVLRGCLRPAPGAGAALAAGKQLALTISLRRAARRPRNTAPVRRLGTGRDALERGEQGLRQAGEPQPLLLPLSLPLRKSKGKETFTLPIPSPE